MWMCMQTQERGADADAGTLANHHEDDGFDSSAMHIFDSIMFRFYNVRFYCYTHDSIRLLLILLLHA